METNLFWGQKVKVTSLKKNIAGMTLCTSVSAGFF